MNRCDSKESELEDAKNKAHSSKIKLDSKQKELGKLVEKEKTVQADFLGLIGENNKFQDYLTKESVLSLPTHFRPRKINANFERKILYKTTERCSKRKLKELFKTRLIILTNPVMKKAQTMILIGRTRIQMQNHLMILYVHLDAHSIYLKKHLHFGKFRT